MPEPRVSDVAYPRPAEVASAELYDWLAGILVGEWRVAGEPSEHDWLELDDLAAYERVVPLLFDSLRRLGRIDDAPNDLHEPWHTSYRAALARHLVFDLELRRILDCLREAPDPISVMLLKGAVLGPSLYPDPALRPMSDLDLLVPARDLPRAAERVRTLGYAESAQQLKNDHDLFHHFAPLQGGPEGLVRVELHHTLVAGKADWRSPPIDSFWRGATTSRFGAGVLEPNPSDHLLYLAAHVVFQNWTHGHIYWLLDLHLLIERDGARLDWDGLRYRAHELKWTVALLAALARVRECFGTRIPAGFLDALATMRDDKAQRFLTGAGAGTLQGSWEKFRAKSTRGRFRLITAHLLPSPAYLRWRYKPCPTWLWPLGYPRRWFESAGMLLGLAASRNRTTEGSDADS